MKKENPIEFSGDVLDERNTLTGPEDGEKHSFPKRPQKVSVQRNDKQKPIM